MNFRLLAGIVSLAAFGSAQQPVVVPDGFATTEAPDVTTVAAAGEYARQQILIDASHLVGLVGESINAIQFRRDSTVGEGLSGGPIALVVRMGAAAHLASQALPAFAANGTGMVEVFRGTVTAPSTPVGAGFNGWDPMHVVEIPLTTPFPYSGGGLCIDIEPLGIDPDVLWPVDAVHEPVAGSVVDMGGACGQFAVAGATAGTQPERLIPGCTARFWFRGAPSSLAMILIGGPPTTPIDLGFLGAPGCALSVSPFAQAPTSVPAGEVFPGFGGIAAVLVELPPAPALLGARFGVQWAGVSTELVTSNALDCTVAATLPTLGVAIVEQLVGATAPEVHLTTAPVMRFETQ